MGREQKRFFNLREQYKATGSDGGCFNIFPVDLSRKHFVTNKQPLRLEISLTAPTLSSKWYLLAMWEHGAQAKFIPVDKAMTTRRFESTFAPLPWN